MKSQKKETIHFDNLRAQFSLLQACPLCEVSYRDDDVRLVEELPGKRIVHIECATCCHAVLLSVHMGTHGLGMFGMLSDLDFDDTMRMRHKQAMTDDELLYGFETIRRRHKDVLQLLLS